MSESQYEPTRVTKCLNLNINNKTVTVQQTFKEIHKQMVSLSISTWMLLSFSSSSGLVSVSLRVGTVRLRRWSGQLPTRPAVW